MTRYEYPLNERIRSLLRMEKAFWRFRHLREQTEPVHHVQALACLFDVLDLSGRTDLRGDLLAELKSQRVALKTFRNSPGVSAPALEQLLSETKQAIVELDAINAAQKPGDDVHDNEWLMAVRSRLMIVGGATDFDMPSFWAWQNLPIERRHRHLDQWFSSFLPYEKALTLSLRLLRESGKAHQLDAADGSCQHSLNGKRYQLAQIRIDETLGLVPDISANKYLLWIRFSTFDGQSRPSPIKRAVTFDLTLCNLDSGDHD